MCLIRDATTADITEITAIYNALIPTTTVAWSEDLQTIEERTAWYERQRQQGFPVLVAQDPSAGAVIGFAAYGHFRGAGCWPGYRFTVEHTVYVHQQARRRGVGHRLMQALVQHAASSGIHVMVGALDGENVPSLEFHRRLGFDVVARMPEVGHKFGRWLDLILVQRILTPNAESSE